MSDDRFEQRPRPTLQDMKARYGDNWGLDVEHETALSRWGPGKPPQAKSWDEIAKSYSANPKLIQQLMRSDLTRGDDDENDYRG